MKTAPPRMTATIAVVTIASFVLLTALGVQEPAANVGGFIPARLSGLQVIGALPVWLTPLSATLLHAGAIHIGFNLLMLFYCGREDEVALGPPGIVVLYVVGAYAAAAAQYVADNDTSLLQRASDQKAAMAIERIAFRAQERDAIGAGAFDDAVEPTGEAFALRHLLVIGATVAEQLW